MSTVLRRYLITLLTKTPMMAVLVVALVAQQDRAIQDAIVLMILRQIHKPTVTEHMITMDLCTDLIMDRNMDLIESNSLNDENKLG